MELIKYSEITTLEEYKKYNRQRYRLWYQKNKEKKLQYNRDRYYNLKNNSKNNSNKDIDNKRNK